MSSSVDNRKVWVAEVPPDNEYGVPPVLVLIEQFGDRPPTIAFRPTAQHVWGRPYPSEPR
jgi:hypothetical protein